MSGGVAYVLDADGDFARHCNTAMVELEKVERTGGAGDPATRHLGRIDEELLRELIEKQFRYTGSFRAREILAKWEEMRGKFVKVMPTEYRRALKNMSTQPAAEAPLQKLAA